MAQQLQSWQQGERPAKAEPSGRFSYPTAQLERERQRAAERERALLEGKPRTPVDLPEERAAIRQALKGGQR